MNNKVSIVFTACIYFIETICYTLSQDHEQNNKNLILICVTMLLASAAQYEHTFRKTDVYCRWYLVMHNIAINVAFVISKVTVYTESLCLQRYEAFNCSYILHFGFLAKCLPCLLDQLCCSCPYSFYNTI